MLLSVVGLRGSARLGERTLTGWARAQMRARRRVRCGGWLALAVCVEHARALEAQSHLVRGEAEHGVDQAGPHGNVVACARARRHIRC